MRKHPEASKQRLPKEKPMSIINSSLLASLKPIVNMKRSKDLSGQRFGRLTAVERLGSTRQGTVVWRCICTCGNECAARTGHLTAKAIVSCGCYQRTHAITHGMSSSDEYQVWASMKDRCLLPSSGGWELYGGRGITVCAEWCGPEGFQRFYECLGPRPSKQYSLERINVDGNYEPSNCKWGTVREQGENKRNSRYIEIDGILKTARGWSDISGIDPHTITGRVRSGWPPREAVYLPTMSRIAKGFSQLNTPADTSYETELNSLPTAETDPLELAISLKMILLALVCATDSQPLTPTMHFLAGHLRRS